MMLLFGLVLSHQLAAVTQRYWLSSVCSSKYKLTVFFGHCEVQCLYTERKKKRRVNFIPKFHSSLKKFVK